MSALSYEENSWVWQIYNGMYTYKFRILLYENLILYLLYITYYIVFRLTFPALLFPDVVFFRANVRMIISYFVI